MPRGQGSEEGAVEAATLGSGQPLEDGPGDDLGMPVVQIGLQAVAKGVQLRAGGLQTTQQPFGLVVVLGVTDPLGRGENGLGVHEQDEGQEQVGPIGQGPAVGIGTTQGSEV